MCVERKRQVTSKLEAKIEAGIERYVPLKGTALEVRNSNMLLPPPQDNLKDGGIREATTLYSPEEDRLQT